MTNTILPKIGETISADQFNKLQNSGAGFNVVNQNQIPAVARDTQAIQPSQQNQENPLIKIARGITGFFGGQKIGEAIGVGLAKSPLSKIITGLNLTPEEKANIHGPSGLQVLGDIGQVALTLGTLGAGSLAGAGAKAGAKVIAENLGKRVLQNAALVAGFGATHQLAEQGNFTPGSIIGSAVAGGTLPVAGKVLGAGFKAITEALPQRLLQSVLRQSPKEILAGKDASSFLLEKGRIGTAGQLISDSRRAIESLGTQIDKNLASSEAKGEAVKLSSLSSAITKKFNTEGANLTRKQVETTLRGMSPQAAGLLNKRILTLPEANRLRRLLDQTLGDRGFLMSQLPFTKQLLRQFANNLRTEIQTKAPLGTRALFKELSKEITVRDNLLERSARVRNMPLSLADLIVGSGGFFGGGVQGAIAGVGAKKALQSPFTSTLMAKGLNRSGKIVSKVLGSDLSRQLKPSEKLLLLKLLTGSLSSNSNNGISSPADVQASVPNIQ